MRTTHYSLTARVYALNEALGRPVNQFSSKVGEQPVKFTVGHICLTHNSAGYTLEEQTSEAGGVNEIACGHSAHEMDILINGLMKGVSLQMNRKTEHMEN